MGPGQPARFGHRAFAWAIDAIPHALVPYVVGRAGGSTVGAVAAFLVTGIVWSMLPEARTGMTVGKRLLGIRVVDARGDADMPIGLARAAVRWVVKYLVSGVLPVGYLWYFRDATRRTWHDRAAGTAVVDLVSPG